jgi:hypothetical protein
MTVLELKLNGVDSMASASEAKPTLHSMHENSLTSNGCYAADGLKNLWILRWHGTCFLIAAGNRRVTTRECTVMRHRTTSSFALGIFSLCTAVAVAPAVQAAPTTDTSVFTQSNTFPAAQVQNWGSLGLSCDGTSCSVSLTPQGVTFFGNEFIGFNLASGATGVTLSSTLVSAGATLSTGSFNLDGFGTFNYLIGLHDGPSSGYSSLVSLFTTNYTGSASSLLTLNSSNFDAAGHVLFTGTSCTGFVGEGTGTENGSSTNCGTVPPPSVPEPSTLRVFGAGLIGLAAASRRRLFER